ncbi:MAG TPA: methyltransferase [Rhodanobacteraceae bacterium]
MVKTLAAASLALALCACGHSAPPASAAKTAAASTTHAPAVAGTVAATSGQPVGVPDTPDEMTPPMSASQLLGQMLAKVLDDPARSKADKALDADRHPAQTLTFFGLRPDMTVIEVDPGKGWYASILAPLLKDNGTYTAAMVSSLSSKQAADALQTMRQLFQSDPGRFARAQLATFDPHTPNLGTPGSADMVLSFRDVQRWIANGTAPAMFRAVAQVLKPGGVFGVVAWRADDDTDAAGALPYVRKATVVELATQAGLQLDAGSGINANPADEGDGNPPPADANRMTLRFVKPASAATAAATINT